MQSLDAPRSTSLSGPRKGESYGKRQIFLNLISEKSKNRIIELIRDADLLVWGYHYPAIDRLGFSIATLKALNLNLVLVRESAYGATGPWANRKGREQLVQTCCGPVVLASEGNTCPEAREIASICLCLNR